jgi:cytochrome c oxidase cbb3-type subunit III
VSRRRGAGRTLLALGAAAGLAACDAGERPVPPPATSIADARQGALQAGPDLRQFEVRNPYDGDPTAIRDGQRLYNWFNCAGCHGGYGGGGIGPPLIGEEERRAAVDFDYIYAGAREGMPAYGGRVPDDQIWRIVAYVHALSRGEIDVPRVVGRPLPGEDG